MTRQEFLTYVGKDVIVDYPVFDELQKWNMKNFSYDPVKDIIKHNRLDLIMDAFIPNARNPHTGDVATHG